MKKAVIIVLAGLIALPLMSQEVPQPVEKSLVKMYPGVVDVEWEIDDEGETFEAKFEINGEDYRVNYDEFGSWVETERGIQYDQLPENVQDFITKYYPNVAVVRVGEREHAERGVYYGIVFDIDGRPSLVMFNSEGQPIK